MEARVIISKETMNKNRLDHKSLRELRMNKLKELDTEGKLSKATRRTDITRMMGFSGGYDRGYSWLGKVISSGILTETFLGIDSKGKPEYEYHLKPTPQPKNKTGAKHSNKIVNPTESMVQITKTPSESLTMYKLAYKVEVIRGDTTIKVELADYTEVSEFVKTILKGE